MAHHVHADRNAAIREALAVGRSAYYTAGGRPPLPRCDSPKWGDSNVRQVGGSGPACTCVDRGAPDAACPYATRAAVNVMRLADGRYVVEICDLHRSQRGAVVDVDGVPTTITDAGAVSLSRAELKDKSTDWEG
jgi:hypothetical protein